MESNVSECLDAVPKVKNTDNVKNEIEERKHFQNIVNAFRCYKMHNLRKVFATLKYINSLPPDQQIFLKRHRDHLRKVNACVEKNYEIIKLLLKDVAHVFENIDHSNDMKSELFSVSLYDLDKLHGIFKQMYREWSIEGKEERDASFKPLLDELCYRFPKKRIKKDVKVLVPGAGLGRLAYEIVKRGYMCQGNEISLFMLFMSNFIMNKSVGHEKYQVYPWIHQSCNHFKSDDQITPITFPDVNPSDLPPNSDFSMAAGSFLEIYTTQDTWDCVVTCFFLDTANNVVSYINNIWHILKPGGLWINLGPLLYHHADLPDQDSIELSYEEIKHIILHYGFCFLKEEIDVLTPYCQNSKSLLTYMYKSILFVCEKRVKVKKEQ